MRWRWASRWVCVALLLVVASSLAVADSIDIPTLSGRVVDQAGVLSSADESKLAGKARTLEKATTIQLVVVTLRGLQGHSIEEWGLALGRGWGIGQKGKDNGILLIVAPSDRELRIEVGGGLEGVLTDSKAAAIIRNVIVPRFKAGNLRGGIFDGVNAIIDIVTGEGSGPPEFSGPVGFMLAHVDWLPWLFVGVWLIIVLIVRITRIDGIRDRIFTDDTWTGTEYNRRTGRLFLSGSVWHDSSGGGGSSGGFSGGGGGFGGGGASGRW